MQAFHEVPALSCFKTTYAETDHFFDRKPGLYNTASRYLSLFKADKEKRYALGITHLLDDLPHNKAIAIKRAMNANFSKGTLYRIQKKERSITPAEQNIIRHIFIQYGIHADPLFDEYIEQYDW